MTNLISKYSASPDIVYNQGSLDYHLKVLTTPYDGSPINHHTKIVAVRYISGWIGKLRIFAAQSDTKVAKYCVAESNRLVRIIQNVRKMDGINWE